MFHNINNYTINLSNILHTGLCQIILTTGTSFSFHISQHLVNILKNIRCYYTKSVESFQFQMGFSFPFLRAKYLRTSLLIMIICSFFTLPYVGGTYARLVYILYKNIFRMIAVLIVFHAANKKNRMKTILNQDTN